MGWYKVVFPGIATRPGGYAQVSAYGTGSERCAVLTFNRTGANANVFVLCHDATGSYVNTRFVASFTGRSHLQAEGATMLADAPTTASYFPANQFSSTELRGYVNRFGTGQYQVTLNGQSTGGNTQVTAYAVSDGSYCKVGSAGGWPLTVVVRCYTSAGTLVDRRFMLQYERNIAAPQTYGVAGFARAHREETTSWYEPSTSFNSAGGSNQAMTVSMGRHRVHFGQLGVAGSGALVTAYGGDAAYCKPTGWSSSNELGGGANLNVACFAPGGAPILSQFEALFLTPTE